MKEYTKNFNLIMNWAKTAKNGDWCEMEGRKVEVANICGGKFLLMDNANGKDRFSPVDNPVGTCNEVTSVACFLMTGKVFRV